MDKNVLAPMEALLAAELPAGDGWRYEPKWDGFRCLARREGDEVTLTSKSGKPLGRYFPEVVEMLRAMKERRFLLDGELVIPSGDVLAFEALQLRLHPAESRVRKLAAETPAELMAFDLLELGGKALIGRAPNPAPRSARALCCKEPRSRPSTVARDRRSRHRSRLAAPQRRGARRRRRQAARPALPSGERAMIKVKQQRTADCVVGGFRYAEKTHVVGSLLLGLYDDEGLLDHVGFTSAIPAEERAALTKKLEALIEPPGFTGRAPGGPSRWNTERTGQWKPLKPVLVVEVRYDQVTARRFRHGTGLVRWRPDKDPSQCNFDQLAPELRPSELKELFGP